MPIYDEDTGTYWRSEDDGGDLVQIWQDDDGWTTVNPNPQLVYDEDSETWGTVGVPNSPYLDALRQYSSDKIPWNYTNVYEGLSNRGPFNLNALWGGSQYAAGRVSDFSHLDPTQLKANQIAGQTRDELWNTYNQLVSQGRTPPKNPDQIALDIYVSNVGQEGKSTGYGPGVNTAALNEYIKAQFLNQPEVVSVTGSQYYTPKNKIPEIQAFGDAHQAAANTWAVFEQQGMGKDSFLDRIIQMAAIYIATQGIGAAMNALASNLVTAAIEGTIPFSAQTTMLAAQTAGMTAAESVVASALTGGIMTEATGGDFVDGFVAGGTAALVKTGIDATNAAKEISSTLQETVGITPAQADRMASVVVKPVEAATTAGLTGKDSEAAALNALVGQGLSAAGDVVADAAKEIAKDLEAQKTAELPAAYTEGRMYAGADTGTMTDVPSIEVVGAPALADNNPRNVVAPEGYRLATYDEAISQGLEATQLPSGESAVLISTTDVSVPAPTQATFASFLDKIKNIGSLFSTGPLPSSAEKYTLFGSGAKGAGKEGFSLFNISFDDPVKQQQAIEFVDLVERDPTTSPEEKRIAQDIKNVIQNAPVITEAPLIEQEPPITETEKQPSKIVAGGGDVGAAAGAQPSAAFIQVMKDRGQAYQLPSFTLTKPQVSEGYTSPADIQFAQETKYGEPGYAGYTDKEISDAIYNQLYGQEGAASGQVSGGMADQEGAGTIGTGDSLVSAGLSTDGAGAGRGTGDVDAGTSGAGVGGGEGAGTGTGTGAGEGEGEGGTGEDTTRQMMDIILGRGQGYQLSGAGAAAEPSAESGAYLGRGITEGTTGEPILGVKGKRKKQVWNIESLRDALGV